MNPRAVLAWTRRLSLWIAAAGLVYFASRYGVERLPSEGCSPLLRFVPGERLLLDRWVRGLAVGDAVLYRPPRGGGLELGKVSELGPSGGDEHCVWVVVDNQDCPRPDSETLGWIPLRSVESRVLMGLPW